MNWPGSDDGTGTEDNEIIDVGEDIDGDGHLDLLFTSWPVGENWRYYGKKYISEDFDMDGVIDNELHIPEINYHDNHDTHLYVYYATGFDNCLADPEFGVLMDTDFIDDFIVNGYGTTRFIAETDGLLHEVGHCLDVGSHEEPDANGDGIIDHEIYCGDSNDPDGGYSWCIMTGIYGFPDNFIQEPIYCDQCWSDFTTDHIWSTINAPIHTFY